MSTTLWRRDRCQREMRCEPRMLGVCRAKEMSGRTLVPPLQFMPRARIDSGTDRSTVAFRVHNAVRLTRVRLVVQGKGLAATIFLF